MIISQEPRRGWRGFLAGAAVLLLAGALAKSWLFGGL